jgi:ribosomal protein S18 acetylase RimI-like enzyme
LVISYKINTVTAGQVLEHLKKCNHNFVPNLDEKVNLELYAEKITKHAMKFEAWVAGELAGLIAAYFNDENKQSAFITNVSTISDYSGKGIASQLLTNCISFAKANRFAAINLWVNSRNSNAIALYSKFGFKQTDVKDEELEMQTVLM